MGTYNLTGLKYRIAGIPNGASWSDPKTSMIETGTGTADKQDSMGITRISFTTPAFLNENIKLTIQVNGLADSTYRNAKYCSMTLSERDFDPTELVPTPLSYRNNDISNALKENRIGTTVQGVLNGDVASFTLTDIVLKSKTPYHLYFLRKDAPMIYGTTANGTWYDKGYAALFLASNISVSLQMEISQLNAPTITTTKQVLPYSEEGEKVTINWKAVSSKTDNTLENYRVYLKVGSKPTSSDKFLEETTATSCEISLTGITRASKVYIGVQAVSQYDKFSQYDEYEEENWANILGNCNSNIATLYLGDLNSRPTAPTLTRTGTVVSGNQSVVFTNFNSTDADGQTLTYHYTLNGSDKIPITGSPLKLSLTLEDLMRFNISNTGSYTINFFAFDTQEHSAGKAVTFRAEFAPVIVERNFSITEAETVGSKAGTPGSEKAVSSITLSYTLEHEFSDLTPRVHIYNKTGKNAFEKEWILTPEYYTVDGKNIIIKPKDMPIDQGTYFKVRFEVLNSSGQSSGLGGDDDVSGVCRKPYMIQKDDFPSMVVVNDATQKDDSWGKYFKNYLTITVGEIDFENIFNGSYYPAIEKITLLTRDKNNKLRTVTFQVGDNIAKLNNAVPNPGDWCTLGLRLTDSVGQTIEQNFSDKYYRVEGLSFNNGNYSVSRDSINPCANTDQSFSITHPIAKSNKGLGNIPISYSYKYSIKNQEIAIEVTSEKLNSVTIQATTKNTEKLKEFEEFKKAVKNIVDPKTNFQGNGTITITAKDAFNQTATYSGLVLETNTKTAPSFGSNKNFILRHNYDMGLNLTNEAIQINDKKIANYRPEIFNSGEKIVFQIPKPTDENDDIVSLKIYLYRNNLSEDKTAIKSYTSEEVTFNSWLTIPITSSSLIEKGGYYYYNYTTSPYSKNEYFYFKITAIDSLGLESSALTNSQYLIGARTVASQIKVTSNSASINTTNNTTTVSLNFDLDILDLGGSATLVNNKVSWDKDYYKEYPNLDREAYLFREGDCKWLDMLKYKYVKVEVSPVADFSTGVKTLEKRLSNADNGQWNFKNLQWDFDDFQSGATRVYVRVRLKVPYAIKTTSATSATRITLPGTPFVYSFFDQSPTIAYRPHQVGINVKNVNTEAVLEISPFDNYKKIILKRDSNKSIVIDIDQLTIDGIIIESGSW